MMHRIMTSLLTCIFFLSWAIPTSAQRSDDEAYEAFRQGQIAYEQGNFQAAVDYFDQATLQAIIFTGAYFIWLGTACERAYDSEMRVEAKNLRLLKKAVDAYQVAFDREHDPDIRYELGRLMVKFAQDSAEQFLNQEMAGQPHPLRSPPVTIQDTARVHNQPNPYGFRPATVDTLNHFWKLADDGLQEVWEAILTRERKERLYTFSPASEMSDTLQAYLSVYIENVLNLVESTGRVNFVGIEPDFYIPKIAAACARGQTGENFDWFRQVNDAVRFDGGYNMRCAIYRIRGLRLSKENSIEPAINALKNSLAYARTDSSRASLYLDMAFTAYRVNLVSAVEFSRLAYIHNPLEPRVRDTYGGLALSLSSAQLKEGDHGKAISAIYPVTRFGWEDRGEALMTLAIAYINSDLSGVLDRAYEAAEKAYRIKPVRYWRDFHRIAKLHGSFIQALDLERKHQNSSRLQSNGPVSEQ